MSGLFHFHFVFCCLSSSGVTWGNSLNREIQMFLSLAIAANSSGGDTKMFPKLPRDIISLACPWSASESIPRWACPKHLLGETSKRHPDQIPEPTQLAPLDLEEQRFYSEPLLDV